MYDLYSSQAFEEKYTYNGCDLGAQWTPAKTVFRVWAPTAEKVCVNLYRSGTPDAEDLLCQLHMRWLRSRDCSPVTSLLILPLRGKIPLGRTR